MGYLYSKKRSSNFTEVKGIDAVRFNSLNKLTSPNNQLDTSGLYGLAEWNSNQASSTTSVTQAQISQLEDKLNLLSNALGMESSNFNRNDDKVLNRMKENAQISTKKSKFYNDTERRIKRLGEEMPGNERIVSETDLNVLKDNYNYIFWAILALGITLIAINLPKKTN
jgi:hypothetical protein